jgi:N-glycosylase/DNA lyase
LKEKYRERKVEIERRLKEFREFLDKSDDSRLFAELAFCICTPQSKATLCWESIKALASSNLLFKGDVKQIIAQLIGVRFARKKASYIVEARNFFTKDSRLCIKEILISFRDPKELRNWLVNNIKGLGLKESSHFIRNIGLSNNSLAILDRHILRCLKELGVIKDIPRSLSKKCYETIEIKMKEFAEEIEMPLDALDLLLWSEKTGFVFR